MEKGATRQLDSGVFKSISDMKCLIGTDWYGAKRKHNRK